MAFDIKSVSVAALAYLGDSVIEGQVRTCLVRHGIATSRRLNALALHFVRASAQCEAVSRILPLLSEEEEAIFRRGRNMGHTNVPKSATVTEYRQATGFEVLFGYLSLLGRDERIGELFSLAYAEQIQELEKGE